MTIGYVLYIDIAVSPSLGLLQILLTTQCAKMIITISQAVHAIEVKMLKRYALIFGFSAVT